MKKLVFAVQVFGIIAMFPIYVILEMNHGTEKLFENKNHPVVKDRVEKTAIRAARRAITAGRRFVCRAVRLRGRAAWLEAGAR